MPHKHNGDRRHHKPKMSLKAQNRPAYKATLGGRWCMNNGRRAFTPLVRGLFDTHGDRHAKAGHSIEGLASDFCACLLIGQGPGVKASLNDGLVAKISHQSRGADMRVRGTLPSQKSPD
jgi:hypothetical protein